MARFLTAALLVALFGFVAAGPAVKTVPAEPEAKHGLQGQSGNGGTKNTQGSRNLKPQQDSPP